MTVTVAGIGVAHPNRVGIQIHHHGVDRAKLTVRRIFRIFVTANGVGEVRVIAENGPHVFLRQGLLIKKLGLTTDAIKTHERVRQVVLEGVFFLKERREVVVGVSQDFAFGHQDIKVIGRKFHTHQEPVARADAKGARACTVCASHAIERVGDVVGMKDFTEHDVKRHAHFAFARAHGI